MTYSVGSFYEDVGTGWCKTADESTPLLYWKNGASLAACEAVCAASWCQAFHFGTSDGNCAVFPAVGESPGAPAGFAVAGTGTGEQITQAIGTHSTCYIKIIRPR